ncbi:MAG: hypothetical protein ACK55I_12140, partial [bacterium]
NDTPKIENSVLIVAFSGIDLYLREDSVFCCHHVLYDYGNGNDTNKKQNLTILEMGTTHPK